MTKSFSKWAKNISAFIGVIASIFLLYIGIVWTYWNWYIPHHCDTLYQEGLNSPNVAENIANQLFNIKDPYGYADKKAVSLITYYARKGRAESKAILENYNTIHGITLESNIPINKNIWGISLGKTTKQDLFKHFNSEGLHYRELENGSVAQVYSNFEFAGVYWDYAYCCFTNNRIYKIIFVAKSDSDKNDFYKLRSMLATKYTVSKNFDSKYPDVFSITDSKSKIELDNSHYKEVRCKYIDLNLEKKKEVEDLRHM